MKKLLLTTAILVVTAAGANAKVCGAANGVDAATPSDAALFTLFNGSCSSDNQASDADDVKAFLDKTSNVTGNVIDMSLSKNTAAAIDQNTDFKDTKNTGSAVGFTDGNGFANIKSTGDTLQAFEIDPLVPSTLITKSGNVPFLGFDGVLFRLQLVDLPGATEPRNDTGSITLSINLSDGSSVTETFTGLKLKADDGVFGFDEASALPKGLFVDSLTVSTDSLHSFDQVKQIMFSPSIGSAVPEPGTWAMLIAGFGFMAFFGLKSRKDRLA